MSEPAAATATAAAAPAAVPAAAAAETSAAATATATSTSESASASASASSASASASAASASAAPTKKSTLKLGASTTANAVADAYAERAKGRLFVVTGAYSGIGVETVKALLRVGAHVVAAGRNQAELDKFVDAQRKAIVEGSGAVVEGIVVDLADLASVRRFAEEFSTKHTDGLDVLINNAGVMNTPKGVTAQGFETQFGVNVIGTFLLTKLLLAALKKKNGRVVMLTSVGHSIHGAKRLDLAYYRSFKPETSEYNGWVQYQQSKLGDLLLAKEFHRRDGIEAASVHPGVISTKLVRHSGIGSLISFAFKNFGKAELPKNAQEGAATTIYAALCTDLVQGGYYVDCKVKQPHDNASHQEDWAALYDYCDEVTKA